MSDAQIDAVAQAIFVARFADESARDMQGRQWADLPESARAIWRRCARAAIGQVRARRPDDDPAPRLI